MYTIDKLVSKDMILGVTGPRPHKLGGFSPAATTRLREYLYYPISAYQPDKVITGMALGLDMEIAAVCAGLGIPFIAAIPFRGQESQWPLGSQKRYHDLLSFAERIVYVCDPGYESQKMQIRNEWIVDNCTHLMSLWDGSPGGTSHCVTYAQKVGRLTVNIWDSWQSFCNK